MIPRKKTNNKNCFNINNISAKSRWIFTKLSGKLSVAIPR